ncbi:MAG TPA: prepilin-type N-terminal cleavage/methylation domain-containing protein [Candidatus Methylacidiphilales bacterium]
MRPTQRRCGKAGGGGARKGFSLVEILVVGAIVSVLATLSVTALPSLLAGGRVSSGSTTLAALFEQARARAVARGIYVYVGVLQVDPQTVLVGMAGTMTGEDDIASASLLAPPVTLSNLELKDSSEVKAKVALPRAASAADSVLESDIGVLTIPYRGRPVSCARVVRFSPTGQAAVRQDNASRQIQVGLAPSRHPNGTDLSLIQIPGLAGSIVVYQP